MHELSTLFTRLAARAANDLRIGALGVLVAACAGCASSASHDYIAGDEVLDRELRVALIPFENLTSYPQAGLIVSQLMYTQLYVRSAFRLIESTELRRGLTQRKIDVSQLSRTTVASELAEALEVDAVLIGSVSEYGYQHGLHEEPVVGINARMVTASGGSVLWASSHSETGRGLLSRDSLNEAAQRVVERMADTLVQRIDAPN